MDDSSCIPQKQCFKCKKVFPATTDYFWINNRTKDHLATRCKKCFHIRNTKPPEGYKRCASCEKDLPMTVEYFSISRERKDGFYSTCKSCKNKKQIIAYRAAKERDTQKIAPPTLVCRKCGESKPATEHFFCKNPLSLYGLDKLCKDCAHEAERTRRQTQSQAQIQERKVYEANYRKTHKKQETTRLRRWFQAGGNEVVKANTRNRRARIRQAKGKHTSKEIREQYERQKHKCYYCQKLVNWKDHTVDHVVPISRGGSNDIHNIVIACAPCNFSKNDRMPHEWPEGGRLF